MFSNESATHLVSHELMRDRAFVYGGAHCVNNPILIMISSSQNVPSHRLMHGCERFCVWVSGNFSSFHVSRAACESVRLIESSQESALVCKRRHAPSGARNLLFRKMKILPTHWLRATERTISTINDVVRQRASHFGTWSKSSPTSLIRPDMRRPDHLKVDDRRRPLWYPQCCLANAYA